MKLPNTPEHFRKVERLGAIQRGEYLARRKSLRDALLEEENNERRIRSLFSHAYLFRLYIFADINYSRSHLHMRESFRCCQNEEEHLVLLHYYHVYLCIYSMTGREEMGVGMYYVHMECIVCDHCFYVYIYNIIYIHIDNCDLYMYDMISSSNYSWKWRFSS